MQHPEPCVAYTYYGYRFNMRAKGKGWRLDYFLVPEAIADHVHDAYHLKHFLGRQAARPAWPAACASPQLPSV